MTIKWVGTYSKREKKIRLFRVLWERGKRGAEGWHSNSFAVSLWPRIFKYEPELWGWAVTILGVRLHRKRAYGGTLV